MSRTPHEWAKSVVEGWRVEDRSGDSTMLDDIETAIFAACLEDRLSYRPVARANEPAPGVAGPYSIGQARWPGLSKLIEESGEVLQIAGKIIATNGALRHWDGSDLLGRLAEECGDVIAAATFVAKHNGFAHAVEERAKRKLALFESWHTNQTMPAAPSPEERHAAPKLAPTSCNRHEDCDAAEAAAKEAGKPERFGKGSVRLEHCSDDECEDCFGK